MAKIIDITDKRRSPHGERGLKFNGTMHTETIEESLSSRRAWIEIVPAIYGTIERASLSSRRAWIEIYYPP